MPRLFFCLKRQHLRVADVLALRLRCCLHGRNSFAFFHDAALAVPLQRIANRHWLVQPGHLESVEAFRVVVGAEVAVDAISFYSLDHTASARVHVDAHPGLPAAFSRSSGQIKCQSVGRSSCRVTIFLVFCSTATQTFSSSGLYPYATFARCRAVVPTLSANALRSTGSRSNRYFLSSIPTLYTNWCYLGFSLGLKKRLKKVTPTGLNDTKRCMIQSSQQITAATGSKKADKSGKPTTGSWALSGNAQYKARDTSRAIH